MMAAVVALFHGVLEAQWCAFPMAASHLRQRRLLRASGSSESTDTCADLEEARIEGVEIWKHLTCVTHESHVKKV